MREAHSPLPARRAAVYAPRDTAHRRARPCGARCASGPVQPGPAHPRYERCGPRSSGVTARRRLPKSVARRFHARGARLRRCAPRPRGTPWSSRLKSCWRRISKPCRYGGSPASAARLPAKLTIRYATRERERLWLREKRVEKIATSADPVVLLGLDVLGRRCIECRAQSTGMILRATAGTPRPWTFFGVAAGLLARRSASYPVFPMRGRISDVKSGTTHCLQLRGQRRILAHSRDTPA